MNKILLSVILLAMISPLCYGKKTCSQFKDYKEANTYFKAKKAGYKGLDRNHDGKPCEALWKKSLSTEKQKTRIRIYKYGSPYSYGQGFSSVSACERARVKLTKSHVGSDYTYKCEKK